MAIGEKRATRAREGVPRVTPFSKKIEAYLEALEISQKQLADTGLAAVSVVSEWCSGNRIPNRAMVGEIAVILRDLATKKGWFENGYFTRSKDGDVKKPKILSLTLVDLINDLQISAGHEPNVSPRNLIWEQRVNGPQPGEAFLKVGFVATPPYASVGGGGLCLDVARRVFGWLGLEVRIMEFSDWNELLVALRDRDIHVIAPLLFRSAHYRTRGIEFSDGIGIRMSHVALLPPGINDLLVSEGHAFKDASDPEATRLNPSAFRRMEFIKYMGGSSSMLYGQIAPRPQFYDLPHPSRASAIEALYESPTIAGKLRCLLGSIGMVSDLQSTKKFDWAFLPYGVDFPADLAFGIDPQECELLKSINLSLYEMRHSGSLAELVYLYYDDLKDAMLDDDIKFSRPIRDIVKQELIGARANSSVPNRSDAEK